MYCRASSCVVKTVFGEGFTLADFYETRAGKKVATKNEVVIPKEEILKEELFIQRTLNSCIIMQVT